MLKNNLQLEFFASLNEPFTGEQLFDQLSEIVFFIKNNRGQYIIANQTMIERCGLHDKSQIIGRTPDEIYPRPLGQEYRKQDEEILRRGEPLLNQLELQLYPSRRMDWCLTTKVPMRGRDGAVVGLAGISKDLHMPVKISKEFPRIAEAVKHIKDHYAEPLKIDEIAERVDISTYQLEQRMQMVFHLTAGQFIQKTRMDAAIWKLRQTDEPIVMVALDCGYGDQSAFTRQFKRSLGLSPAQYRRIVKDEKTNP